MGNGIRMGRWHSVRRRVSFLARSVAAVLLACAAAQAQAPDVEFVYVPGDDTQPNGPAYDFRIGRYEIRNDQFARFLNDALGNLDNERGWYMFFDVDSGDVYIHSTQIGETGTDGSGTLLFGAGANGHIAYDEGAYVVELDFEAHPATGVSWYGAVKYCNWLTIDTGLSPSERAYDEAGSGNLNGWHPVTISDGDWAIRDLDAGERAALLVKLGYRLPMDGAVDPASAYNEWYKAAAWDESLSDNHTYGFGRDALTGPDANYRCSGDPFEDPGDCIVGATTPVGYYDGTLYGGVYQTNADENYYGLYDVSGNVWEWMQDQGYGAVDRRNRGGSWRSSPDALQDMRGFERDTGTANDSTGFRVVQSAPVDILVTPQEDVINGGPWGGPYDDPNAEQVTYTITNVTDQPITFSTDAEVWLAIDNAPVGGEMQGGESVDLIVSLAPDCTPDDGLTLGLNVGVVTITFNTDEQIQRYVELTVDEPLSLTPASGLAATMLAHDVPDPADKIYTWTSISDSPVTWSASWEDTTPDPPGTAWLVIDDLGTTQVDPQAQADVVLIIDSIEAALLDVGVYSADVTFVDECTDNQSTRTVTLTVNPWFTVEPSDPANSTGAIGGPFDPPVHDYTITRDVAQSITWTTSIAYDPSGTDWLDLLPDGGTLDDDNAVPVAATINAAAGGLDLGTYEATISFVDAASGFTIDRLVTLEVTGAVVEPPNDVLFAGPLAGPFAPDSHTYTLRNTGLDEMDWTAEFAETTEPPSGVSWLDLAPSGGTILDPDGTVDIVVTLSAQAAALPTGTYTGDITFTSVFTGATAVRQVTVIVGGEAFTLKMASLEADTQTDGPDYMFRMGESEVTTEQFVRFLNDTLVNLDNPRGYYMFFDTSTGDVYINDDPTGVGATGTDPGPLTVLLFSPSVAGRISFFEARYSVFTGEEDKPVSGVTWYGAIKFCNWLTLVQGMTAAEQAYQEAPAGDLNGWHPVTISDANWSARDLDAAERAALLALPGYRLPMDDGSAIESTYNEWYKAASRAGVDDGGEPVFGAVYGFGRDVLVAGDANYIGSGDPFDDAPTPVRFYDGTLYNPGGNGSVGDGSEFQSVGNGNGHGIYDLSGNVAEWMQDRGSALDERATRGGHFASGSPTALEAASRAPLAPESAYGFVGFRVVQAFPPRVRLDRTGGEHRDAGPC